MRELRPLALGVLAPSAAALALGILLGSAAPADAQNGGGLEACVNVDRHGHYHGDLRLVGRNQRCGPREVRVTLALMGAGGIAGPPGPQGPAGPTGPVGPRGFAGAAGPAGPGGSHWPCRSGWPHGSRR